MNAVDIGVILVVALSAIGGFRRGLIYSVYKLVSFFVALFLSLVLYSPIADFIRQTVIYDWLKGAVSRGLDLEGFLETAARRGHSLIDTLPLPVFVQELLHVNNNARMYQILRVSTIEDFIAGFFANIIIMALAVVLVFVCVMAILSIIGGLVDIVGRLPVIRTINSAGGLVVGALFGVALAALTLFLLNVFFFAGASPFVSEMLQDSLFSTWVFDILLPSFFEIYP